MNFDSAAFLCCFLPLLAGLYFLIRGEKGRNVLLLIAGLVFYSFGSLTGLLLLLAAALVNYLLGLLILRRRAAKAVKTAAVALDLLFLAAFKYLNFLLSILLPGLPAALPALSLAAPIGISFFTFKCISYIIDTYRAPENGTRSFFGLLLYISFFPQVMAGPITRFSDFSAQLHGRMLTAEELAAGLRRFIAGLGKKLILAGALSKVADAVYALEASALDARLAWAAAIAYTLQIYFDFSAYSDMAIGLGRMFGFRTAENFDYPYISGSITEFWRRWHISLSGWFRDYLYIPLGGSRRGTARAALNKLIVFTLCGLWHGAAWTFLLWGFWHGVLAALETLKLIRPGKKTAGKVLGHVYTLLAVCLGFVMFRADSLSEGARILCAMFTGFRFTAAGTAALHGILNTEAVVWLLVSAVLCTPVSRLLVGEKAVPSLKKIAEPASYAACVLLVLLCLARLAAGGFSPFIYFQF